MFIIGISGKKQSGKDTVAMMIRDILHPRKVARIGFADDLKFEVSRACGTTIAWVDEHKDELRLLLQAWGTDFRRNLCDEDYWVKKMLMKIQPILSTVHTVIIPDVRFKNEADMVHNLNGYLLRIDRPIDSKDVHVSETELDHFIFPNVIVNNGSLENLKSEVTKFLTAKQVI